MKKRTSSGSKSSAAADANAGPPLLFEDQEAWFFWLRKNHATSSGVWLRIAKKGAVVRSVSYLQAVECALCFGWIDGRKKSDNESYWLQRFTPRSEKSIWSKINREKAIRLIELGQMSAAGLREVERENAMVVGMGRTIRRAAPRYRRTFRPYLTKFRVQGPSSLPLTVGTGMQCYSGFRPPRRLRLAPNGSSSSPKCFHSTRESTGDAQPFVAADRLRRPLNSNVRRRSVAISRQFMKGRRADKA